MYFKTYVYIYRENNNLKNKKYRQFVDYNLYETLFSYKLFLKV